MCFVAMKQFGVDANIVALSGIAIAIGTMVDMGIVLCENILKHVKEKKPEESHTAVIFQASKEVSSAVLTAVATTVVSFLPVFTMIGAEGKLFKPLAYTKTFALLASLLVSLFILPAVADLLFRLKNPKIEKQHRYLPYGFFLGAILCLVFSQFWLGALLLIFALLVYFYKKIPQEFEKYIREPLTVMAVLMLGFILTKYWLPLGPEKGFLSNLLFVALITTLVLGGFYLFQKKYERILSWALAKKKKFLLIPTAVIAWVDWCG